jgi:two-component system alkaline phosphatase synthesis response regulator PhoP
MNGRVQMSFRILMVDDEIDDAHGASSALLDTLRKAGYEVRATSSGSLAYDLVEDYHPDLILLDIALGDQLMDGIALCEAIRLSDRETPIILVTSRRRETPDILRGFEAGADDYVTLPRDPRETLARVRANLPPGAVVFDDYLHIDLEHRRVWIKRDHDGQRVHLSPLLWELLYVLVLNAGLTVVTTTLKDRVWGKAVSDGALAVAIRRLREKLEPDPSHPVYIEAVRTIGYRFNGTPGRTSLEPPMGQTVAPSGSAPPDPRLGTGKRDDPGLKSQLMACAEAAVTQLLIEERELTGFQRDDAERLARAAGAYVVQHFTRVLVEHEVGEGRRHV